MTRHSRSIHRLTLIAVLGALLLVPARAKAGTDFGVRAGVYTDESDAFVGLELLSRLSGSQWFFNPNLESVFIDHGNLFTFNADFHYDFATSGQFNVWLGGGPALIVRDPDRGSSKTDPGLNILAGVGFNPHSAVRPYIQGKAILSDNSEAVFAVGVRF